LIGFAWAVGYAIIELINPGSFSGLAEIDVNNHAGRMMQMQYFSFTTLTTLGFGDILPRSSTARTLATLEAMTGQIYLAVLIARLVGLHIVHSTSRTGKIGRLNIAPVVIVITAARNLAGHAVCGQRARNRSLRHGHEPREEPVARLDVAGSRAVGGDPAAQSQIAAHTAGFGGVHVNGVGVEIAFKAMRADLNICMVARKRSRIIEGPHDVPRRLSWRRQIDIQGPFVRPVEPIITEPDHEHGPVVEQPIKIPPLEIIRGFWRAPPIFSDRDFLTDAEGFEVLRRYRR
jgi:hypothetical protein